LNGSPDTWGITPTYAPLVPQLLCARAAEMLGTDHAAVFVRERRRRDRMIAVAATEIDLVGSRCDARREPAALVMCSGRPVYVPNYRLLDRPLTLPGTGATRVGAAPVSFAGAVRGALAVWAPESERAFGLSELELLGDLAELVGRSLERGGDRDLDDELRELDEALAEVDEPTARHVEHVVWLARELGEMLGLSPVELLELELGAHFHDVGKVRVPPAILCKPGRLSSEEWDLMRRHSEWGAQMLAEIPGLEAVSLVVRCHHERWGGRGYPAGLEGERIPLAARIVAVCDAFSAMTSERPYSAPLSTGEALGELDRGAGSQFDPEVAAALCDLVQAEAIPRSP
jgi:HD-GYP domain-containing protein (c-di-GMP phosphodiesterase class II)